MAAAAEIEAGARLEPEVIGIDESAVLTLEVSGGGFTRLRFRPDFQLENLEIVGGPFRYEDVRFGNGSLSHTARLSWQVRPLALGTARVHSLSIALQDDVVVHLADRTIRVQEEPTRLAQRRPFGGRFEEPADPFGQLFGQAPRPWRWPERRPEEPGVFLRSTVEPQRPVVGQQVVYTIHLYTREDITAITPSDMPSFRGFWVRDLPPPSQSIPEMVEIDGRRYGRVVLLRKALFPLRPGRSEIEPAEIDLSLRVFERRFFAPPISRPVQKKLHTQAAVIDVQPLPPAPPGFGGTVGRLSATARLDPPELRLGEAATLTLTVSGEGNLTGLREPELKAPDGLVLSPPQQGGKDEAAGTTVRGTRTWSFAVVPERSGRYTLSAPAIPYFDPQSGAYRVAAAEPLDLTVLPRVAAMSSEGGAGGAPHGIRTAALASRAGFMAWRWADLLPWLFALPWGLALVVTLVRRQAGTRAGAQAIRPAADRDGERRLAARLAQAESTGRSRQAAAQIEEAWREFLAARWDVPPSAPPSHWGDLLAGRNAPPEAVAEMGRLVDDLHYLRHAPQLSAVDTVRGEVLDRCRRLARRLR